jgi:hypothetical protein
MFRQPDMEDGMDRFKDHSKSFGLALVLIASMAPPGFAQDPDIVDDSVLASGTIRSVHVTPHDLTNGQAHSRFGIFGIDSIPNFNLHFFADGVDSDGNPNRHWYTNTVGNPPQMGGTTIINAPLQPVNVELDDVNGNVRVINGHSLISSAVPLVAPVLNSPIFSNAVYSSGSTPTQFTDAIQRAEFFNKMKPDWHTLLNPRAAAPLTVHIRQTATCGPGITGCNYYFSLNGDGTCCRFILIEINPFVNALVGAIVTDIAGNVITTQDISSFLFPNTLLYVSNRFNCCIGGFHTYLSAPSGDLEMRWVLNYSTWITPGLMGADGPSDVMPLSHELAETFNDPFVASDGVHNLTPWWLSPNGNCQNDLEVGDVIEGLPGALFPMTMNGFNYHPQNEALLQWFQFQTPSDALGGAYSYPNTTVLTQPSARQNVNCAP